MLAGLLSKAGIEHDEKQLTQSSPCESALSNILEETSIETLVTVGRKNAESKICIWNLSVEKLMP